MMHDPPRSYQNLNRQTWLYYTISTRVDNRIRRIPDAFTPRSTRYTVKVSVLIASLLAPFQLIVLYIHPSVKEDERDTFVQLHEFESFNNMGDALPPVLPEWPRTLTANLPTRVPSDIIPERVSAITDYISRRPRKSVGSLSWFFVRVKTRGIIP